MTCRFKAPNGETSSMYEDLAAKYGEATARRTFVFTNTPVFKEQYALPVNDKGEYAVADLEAAGVVANIEEVFLPFIGREQIEQQVTKLHNAFDAVGIDVDVEADENLDTTAKLITKHNRRTIKYNPTVARRDSIWHEHGHILVDAIGYDSEIIQTGINQLRDSKLWKMISALYPELDGAALEKEVLTTAIGLNADKVFRAEGVAKWKFWLKQLMRNIAKLFGVEINVAEDLASQLVRGNITESLEYHAETSIQHQKDFRTINDVFATKYDFLNKLKSQVQKKIAIYYGQLSEAEKAGNANYRELEELGRELDKFAQLDADEGLIAFLFEALDQTAKLEKRVGQLLHPTADDIAAGRDKIDSATIQKVTNYNTIFSLIEDLIDIVENDTDLKTKLEERQIQDSTLYRHIQTIHARYIAINKNASRMGLRFLGKKLQEMGRGRIEALEREKLEKEYNRVNEVARAEAVRDVTGKKQKEYREARRKWINAKIAEQADSIAEREADRYQTILQQSRGDISWLERMFLDGDAINDDIIQLGSEMLDDADYQSMRSNIDAYKDMDTLFREYEQVYPSTNMQTKYDQLIADEYEVNPATGVRRKTGKKTNRLVSQFLYEFEQTSKQLWGDYYKIAEEQGEASDEAIDARNKAIRFQRENTKSRFTDEYHTIMDSLSARAKVLVDPLKSERRAILAKYKKFRFEDGRTAEIYDMTDVTAEDKNRLDAIARSLNELAATYDTNGNEKTGEALGIAEELTAYNKKISDIFEDGGVAEAAFEARKEKVATKGEDVLKAWLDANQSETLTDEFWNIFNSITSDSANKTINKQINALLKPFRKANGEYDALNIPETVRTKLVKLVEQRIENSKNPANKLDPMSADWISRNVAFEKTAAYETAKAKAIAEGTFEQWKKDNHDSKGEPLPFWTTITSYSEEYKIMRPNKNWQISKVKDKYIDATVAPDEDGMPTDNWIDPQWEALQRDRDNNGVASRMYDHLIKVIEDSDKGLPEWAKLAVTRRGVTYYKMPAVTKRSISEVIGEQGITGYVSSRFDRFKKNKDDEGDFGTDTESGTTGAELATAPEAAAEPVKRILQVLANERGEQRHGVPINLRYDIKVDEQSFDLPSIFLLNKYMADNFRNKEQIIADLELMRDFLQNRDVQQTRSTFFQGIKHLTDKFIDKDNAEDAPNTPIVAQGVDSNAYKAFQSMIEDRAYGISSKSGYKISKLTSMMVGYSGNVMLIGNYLSAGANLLNGLSTDWLAAMDGRFFNKNDMAVASWKYSKDIPAIIGDMGARVYTAKVNLLMERFNTTGDWDAVTRLFADDTRFKALFKSGTLHGLNNLAEHTIQNTLMLAILNNIKVMNANGEYLTATGTTTDINQAMSLDEAYRVENKRLVLDDRVAMTTDNEVNVKDDPQAVEFLVARKIRDMAAYMHGQYSKQKRAEIQRSWYGVMIMALRKWMPRGYAYRMRGLDTMAIGFNEMTEDDRFHSRALNGYMEGYYTTTGRFIIQSIRDVKDMMFTQTSLEGKKSLSKIVSGNWKELTDWQQGNIVKTMYDFGIMIGAVALGYALKGLGDDEKDAATKKAYYALAFYSLRLNSELSTYINPIEFTRVLRNPSIVIGMSIRILDLLQQLGHDAFGVITGEGPELYKTGKRKGDLKLEKKIEDVLPLLKHLDRDMQEAVGWFSTRKM